MIRTVVVLDVRLGDVVHPLAEIVFETTVGEIRVLAEVFMADRTLVLEGAHVDGGGRGTLGRAGLNALARALLEVTDAERLVARGAVRTSGARPGHTPRPFRFPG